MNNPIHRPLTAAQVRAKYSGEAVARRALLGTDEPRWPSNPPISTPVSRRLAAATERAVRSFASRRRGGAR